MKIAILNGPNLNMLGKRNPAYYGQMTLDELDNYIDQTFIDVDFIFFQTNHEGQMIDFLQSEQFDGLVINAGAYTHTSIALRDALESIDKIKVEVHLSNIYERETFRKVNYIKDVVDASFFGKKAQSYVEAITYILEKLS